jgi:hypothetical protein
VQRIAAVRTAIYDHFQSSQACQAHFYAPANEESYVGYYNSMYLLQDSTESLLAHRQLGFSAQPLSAYLEFWGIMQALIIQQDALCELHEVVLGSRANTLALVAWNELRELRNLCAGHPAKKTHRSPLNRTFMGRNFGSYSDFTYERWEKGAGISHPHIALGSLIDRYAAEAASLLSAVLVEFTKRWP